MEELEELEGPPEEKFEPIVEQTYLLKLQLVYWLTTDAKDFEEVVARFQDKFSLFKEFIVSGWKIAEREFRKLTENKKRIMKDAEGYAMFKLSAYVTEILEKKMASYESRGLTKEQIKKEIKKTSNRFDWEDQGHDVEDPLILHEMWLEEKYEMKEKEFRNRKMYLSTRFYLPLKLFDGINYCTGFIKIDAMNIISCVR
ncbi:hypothetical protein PMAYCL1PPCAC_06080 [Pristionchus mayeri]|uniref:Uncharacterized protein n=1 Tax=Pristionchus mayeri TaxID=1317129 RepID=A0AAN5C9R7_9BILA|nr:hypothetical protein PMAYCL1PPCAC_06080 [Pristionchus mayeri]